MVQRLGVCGAEPETETMTGEFPWQHRLPRALKRTQFQQEEKKKDTKVPTVRIQLQARFLTAARTRDLREADAGAREKAASSEGGRSRCPRQAPCRVPASPLQPQLFGAEAGERHSTEVSGSPNPAPLLDLQMRGMGRRSCQRGARRSSGLPNAGSGV